MPAADPSAVVESQRRQQRSRERHQTGRHAAHDRLLTHASGVSKMMGVTITSERNGKTFVIKAKEGELGANDSAVQLTGDVRMDVSDGLVLTLAQSATYVKAENVIRVPGDATFTRARMTAAAGDRLRPDARRPSHRRERDARCRAGRGRQRQPCRCVRPPSTSTASTRSSTWIARFRSPGISSLCPADQAVAHLSADEEHLDLPRTAWQLEGRRNAGVWRSRVADRARHGPSLRWRVPGASARAVINGDAFLRLAGEQGQAGRTIAGSMMTIGLGADGATVSNWWRATTCASASGEGGAATRTIAAQALDSTGDGSRG